MRKISFYSIRLLLVFLLISFSSYKVYGEELESVLQELEILKNDIKTLEKAVYNQDVTSSEFTLDGSNNANDVLTKHLLKLSELEEQFKLLTNNFEEVNFKLDKLSSRITKIQTDNQMRFQDLESSDVSKSAKTEKTKKLPGSDAAQDLGQALEIGVADSDASAAEQIQQTQSIDSVGSVVTETTEETISRIKSREPYTIITSDEPDAFPIGDQNWIKETYGDLQLSLALRAMQEKLDKDNWPLLTQEDPVLTGIQEEVTSLAKTRIEILKSLVEIDTRLTTLQTKLDEENASLIPNGINLKETNLTLKDSEGNIIGSWIVTNGDIESALDSLQLSPIKQQ